MMGAWEKIVPALERLSGDTGVYLCNLVTGDMRAYAADKPVVAASVIKIPVMIEVFRQARDGLLDLNEIHRFPTTNAFLLRHAQGDAHRLK